MPSNLPEDPSETPLSTPPRAEKLGFDISDEGTFWVDLSPYQLLSQGFL